MISLADRIRGIVAPRVAPESAGVDEPALSGHAGSGAVEAPGTSAPTDIAAVLGGTWREANGGRCMVVDRRWEPSALHGRERVGALAERLDRAAGDAPLFTGGAIAPPPFIFFDLETTGLSGGAGTLAFLVGCGWFDGDGSFATRQFLLARHTDERMLLEAVAGELARAGALVSFNGKSFDAPLLEGRYLFHRMPWCGRQLPHVDVLHPARRFWRRPPARGAAVLYPSAESSCSLVALERQIVGARRHGDVPGFEIPGRYFQFLRSGDAAPLEAVLEHNRLDLLTLAALTTRLLHMTRSGPDAIVDAREAVALGHVYLRAHQQHQGAAASAAVAPGLEERAYASFRRALDRCRSPRGAYDPIRIDALRALALAWRRARRHDESASAWAELAAMRGCPTPILREATEALAIHHEHRVRDLQSAKAFALQSLETDCGPGWAGAARYRLARLDRKISGGGREGRSLEFEAEV